MVRFCQRPPCKEPIKVCVMTCRAGLPQTFQFTIDYQSQPMQVWSFLLQTQDLLTCHYIKFKQMASYYPMLAPQCCGNECFFNWLGGHVLEERLPSAPNVLPSENELSTARGPHLHYPLWEPQTCHTAQFLRVSRSRRTEIASHFISSSEFLQAGAIFLCRSVVRSNKHIPVAETTTPFPVSLFPR